MMIAIATNHQLAMDMVASNSRGWSHEIPRRDKLSRRHTLVRASRGNGAHPSLARPHQTSSSMLLLDPIQGYGNDSRPVTLR